MPWCRSFDHRRSSLSALRNLKEQPDRLWHIRQRLIKQQLLYSCNRAHGNLWRHLFVRLNFSIPPFALTSVQSCSGQFSLVPTTNSRPLTCRILFLIANTWKRQTEATVNTIRVLRSDRLYKQRISWKSDVLISWGWKRNHIPSSSSEFHSQVQLIVIVIAVVLWMHRPTGWCIIKRIRHKQMQKGLGTNIFQTFASALLGI